MNLLSALLFPAFAVLAALASRGPSASSEPSATDLERSLRESSSSVFGSDSEPPWSVFLRMEPRSVPDDLLVAVLISGATGGADPVDRSRELLRNANFRLSSLLSRDPWDKTPKIGDSARARVVAAVELARRNDLRNAFTNPTVINSADKAAVLLRTLSKGLDESLSILFLDRRLRVVGSRILTTGSSSFTIVDPLQILREAFACNASFIILGHNHPSGDPSPSTQDHEVTKRVVAALGNTGIKLVDHVVVTDDGRFTSLANLGQIPPSVPYDVYTTS